MPASRYYMSRLGMLLMVACALSGANAAAQSTVPRDPQRGELLYSTHCIACHTAQLHWRDRKLATDWASLKREVRRFQDLSALGWNDDDVTVVTRYLNRLYYNFPSTNGKELTQTAPPRQAARPE
jgi:mono/diheme cytochrome c family protein